MRKLNKPMPNGGAPFTNEDLNDVFQTEIWDAIQSLLFEYNSDSEGVIVSGCLVSANASNFDMTAGIVYLNGEFMRVDAVTNLSFPRYIKAATPTNVTRTFENTTTQTFIIERKAEVSTTNDGSGQEITISSLTNSLSRRIEVLLGNSVLSKQTSGAYQKRRITTRILAIGDWNMNSTASISVAHDLAFADIITFSAVIIDDIGSQKRVIGPAPSISSTPELGGSVSATAVNINLNRVAGGVFQSTDFDSTGYNRGFITVTHFV